MKKVKKYSVYYTRFNADKVVKTENELTIVIDVNALPMFVGLLTATERSQVYVV